MKKSFVKIPVAALLLLFTVQVKAQSSSDYYVQGNGNRMAAEWEPALGTLITWPLCIPYKLAVELAKDDHLYVLVDNDSTKKDARQWFHKWGIKENTVTFIFARQGIDAWWVRDWGPGAIFNKSKKMQLADGKYIYSTPVSNMGCSDTLMFLYTTTDNKIIKTETDDSLTLAVGKGLNIPVLDLPFITTGGNVISDGLGNAFSTCILLNENKFYGVGEDRFFKLNNELAGLRNYHIISNFEHRGIQHIDCYMKLLDEERLLVCEPPADHALYPVYQNIIDNELSKLTSAYGRPYEILRIKSDRYKGQALAAYTNSIIINKTIYVPLFHIRQDSLALERWREVMPGYTIKGFEYALADEPVVSEKIKEQYKVYGWNNGDALHCRTRAIWDDAMLFMSVKRIDKEVDEKNSNTVHASIIDYSNKGLVKNKAAVLWRIAGEKNWKRIALQQDGNENNFSATIPFHKKGAVVEYYVTASSRSGKTATMPRTAPLGVYTFSIK
ncbi:agmatine deiminase family protein [Ferruginibacter sp.]